MEATEFPAVFTASDLEVGGDAIFQFHVVSAIESAPSGGAGPRASTILGLTTIETGIQAFVLGRIKSVDSGS